MGNNNHNGSSNCLLIIEGIPGHLNGFEPLSGVGGVMNEETKRAKK